MKITYNGHACFTVESEGYRIVLDPFRGVNGFEDISLCAEEVLCSHEHGDHNYREGVQLTEGKTSPFRVQTIDCFHDDKGGSLRGTNKIAVLEAEGKKVAHFGDLGHDLTPEMTAALQNLDCILIPIGGFFTIDAAKAAEIVHTLAPKKIVPMHYKDGEKGLPVLASAEDFIALLTEEEKAKLLLVQGYGQTAEL